MTSMASLNEFQLHDIGKENVDVEKYVQVINRLINNIAFRNCVQIW